LEKLNFDILYNSITRVRGVYSFSLCFLLSIFLVLRYFGVDGFYGGDSYKYLRMSKTIVSQFENSAEPTKSLFLPVIRFLVYYGRIFPEGNRC